MDCLHCEKSCTMHFTSGSLIFTTPWNRYYTYIYFKHVKNGLQTDLAFYPRPHYK